MRVPEITRNSVFGTFIRKFIKNNEWIVKVLEIGSGSGNGSTQCFIESLVERKDSVLYCIETNEEWYSDLVENTKEYSFVKTFNKSSISYENMLVKKHSDFMKDKQDEYKIPWFEEDIKYFKNTKIGEGVIENNETYDCVLIDGSEFSGYSEYLLLKDRVKCILLDDINVFKCSQVHQELLDATNWKLISSGNERNGWSCFINTLYKPNNLL